MVKIKKAKHLPKEMSQKMKVKVKLNFKKNLNILNAYDMVT
jgi:hypothetical protein